MEFNDLVNLVGTDSVFNSALLLAGKVDPAVIRMQLSRWAASGKITQLRRGVYALNPPYQKVQPHPFLVANRLKKATYVSVQSALSFYNLIPEVVNTITSVSTGRTERLENTLGFFEYRHVLPHLFFGYDLVDLGSQKAYIATPEKSLLDLIYLHPASNVEAYIDSLRLQNATSLDQNRLDRYAGIFGKPKIRRAVDYLLKVIRDEDSFEVL